MIGTPQWMDAAAAPAFPRDDEDTSSHLDERASDPVHPLQAAALPGGLQDTVSTAARPTMPLGQDGIVRTDWNAAEARAICGLPFPDRLRASVREAAIEAMDRRRCGPQSAVQEPRTPRSSPPIKRTLTF
jgi:hypothetical protein